MITLHVCIVCFFFFFSSRRRHTRYWRDWSSDVCSSDLMRPVADRGLRNPEGGLRGLADSDPTGSRILPREERDDRPGAADLVAVIEVIRPGIVEIDGPLHEAQAERCRVEDRKSTRLNSSHANISY